EGIGRIESRVVPADEELPVEFIGAGFGEDFDPAVAQLVEFGRERVLVDANLANRRLWRKLPGSESVNIELPPVRPRGRPRQGLQISQQLIRIVRQGLQFFS